jgi:hypothetical protein
MVKVFIYTIAMIKKENKIEIVCLHPSSPPLQ